MPRNSPFYEGFTLESNGGHYIGQPQFQTHNISNSDLQEHSSSASTVVSGSHGSNSINKHDYQISGPKSDEVSWRLSGSSHSHTDKSTPQMETQSLSTAAGFGGGSTPTGYHANGQHQYNQQQWPPHHPSPSIQQISGSNEPQDTSEGKHLGDPFSSPTQGVHAPSPAKVDLSNEQEANLDSVPMLMFPSSLRLNQSQTTGSNMHATGSSSFVPQSSTHVIGSTSLASGSTLPTTGSYNYQQPPTFESRQYHSSGSHSQEVPLLPNPTGNHLQEGSFQEHHHHHSGPSGQTYSPQDHLQPIVSLPTYTTPTSQTPAGLLYQADVPVVPPSLNRPDCNELSSATPPAPPPPGTVFSGKSYDPDQSRDSHMSSGSIPITAMAHPQNPVFSGQSYNPDQSCDTHMSSTSIPPTGIPQHALHVFQRNRSSRDSGFGSSLGNGSINNGAGPVVYPSQLPCQDRSFEDGTFVGTSDERPQEPALLQRSLSRQNAVQADHSSPLEHVVTSGPFEPSKEACSVEEDRDSQIMHMVARQVNSKWTVLARRTENFSEKEIEEIKVANRDILDRSGVVLSKIRKMENSGWKKYIRSLLLDMGMILTAHEMKQCLDQDTISSLHHAVSLEDHCEFLLYLTVNIEEHWKELAVQLNVNWLESADRCVDAPKSVCCLEVIQLWLESNKSHTFMDLLMAVESTTVCCSIKTLIEKVKEAL